MFWAVTLAFWAVSAVYAAVRAVVAAVILGAKAARAATAAVAASFLVLWLAVALVSAVLNGAIKVF